MMAVVFFIAHVKGFKFHAQPQTGAYSCLGYMRIPLPFTAVFYNTAVFSPVPTPDSGGMGGGGAGVD